MTDPTTPPPQEFPAIVKVEGTGYVSLNRVAQLHGLSPLQLIQLTLELGSPDDVAAFANYLGSSIMQQGLVYYLPSE